MGPPAEAARARGSGADVVSFLLRLARARMLYAAARRALRYAQERRAARGR